jgi:hypothetical protein
LSSRPSNKRTSRRCSSRRLKEKEGRTLKIYLSARSPTISFPKWQAPKHSKPPKFYKCQLEFSIFDALSYRSWMEPLDAYTIPCPVIYLESYVGLGSNICLAMLGPVEVE